MAKNRNTFAKRSRETDKKRKAQDKIERRRQRKDAPDVPVDLQNPPPDEQPSPPASPDL